MSVENISASIKTTLIKKFKDSFVSANNESVAYVFIGNSQEYANVEIIPDAYDTDQYARSVWDNMISAKKLISSDMEIVLPKHNWVANTIYQQYDDTKTISDLTSIDVSDNTHPMYVYTTEGNVYKCMCNDAKTLSTIEPTGDYSSANGFIYTSDGYLWKYLYNIKPSNKFNTESWMPVPYGFNSVDNTYYNLSVNNLVEGGLVKIIPVNRGNNYYHTDTIVSSFSSGEGFLTVANTNNMVANMAISGTGILTGTYITSISNEFNRIYLSNDTIASGGGAGNTVSILTRVVVNGDGSGITTEVDLDANNRIHKITVTSIGIGYTKANATIYGSGTNATARCVLSPAYGHGINPAQLLGANTLMVVKRVGEIDASESGLISTDTSFRQYGILINPSKYGESGTILYANANTVISQTTDLTLLTGSLYTLNEYVYQGSSDNPTFYGYINAQDLETVKLTNVFGSIDIGGLLIGANSAVARPIVSIKRPEFEPYTGMISYVKNVSKIERSLGQSEEFNFVITI